MELISLEQWRQEQMPTGQSAFADLLVVDRLYAIDGGMFQAQQTEDGRWELWTWMGKAGRTVARTGLRLTPQAICMTDYLM